MFLTLVKNIFGKFALSNDFLIKEVQENYSILYSKDFDIVLSYDDRDNEINIDFDLSRYNKVKENPQNIGIPVFLNIDLVLNYYKIQKDKFSDDKTKGLQTRLEIQFLKLETIWSILNKQLEYKDILSEQLLSLRKQYNAINENQKKTITIEKASKFFKEKKFNKVVEMLLPIKEDLNNHDLKVLNLSIKKMNQ